MIQVSYLARTSLHNYVCDFGQNVSSCNSVVINKNNSYDHFPEILYTKVSYKTAYVNSADPDQTSSLISLHHLPFFLVF